MNTVSPSCTIGSLQIACYNQAEILKQTPLMPNTGGTQYMKQCCCAPLCPYSGSMCHLFPSLSYQRVNNFSNPQRFHTLNSKTTYPGRHWVFKAEIHAKKKKKEKEIHAKIKILNSTTPKYSYAENCLWSHVWKMSYPPCTFSPLTLEFSVGYYTDLT